MKNLDIVLEKIGLSKKESQIYLYLVEKGKSIATNIAKGTYTTRTSIYQILKSLENKELIIKSIKNNISYFEVSNIQNISLKLKEEENKIIYKKNILDSIIPELQKLSLKQNKENKSEVITYLGFEGYKKIIEMCLLNNQDKNIYMISSTNPNLKNKEMIDFEKDFLRNYRKKNNIKLFLITEENELSKYIKHIDNIDIRETKFLKEKLSLETIIVYGENLVISKDDGNIHTTIIQDKNIAKTIEWMFMFLWKNIN